MQWLIDTIKDWVNAQGYALESWVEAKGYLTTSFVDRGDPAAFDFTLGQFTTDGNWHDKDLSNIVPAGAKAILIRTGIKSDVINLVFQLRKNGNINTINASVIRNQVANIHIYMDMTVTCDANRKIEYNATAAGWTTIDFVVKGWWL